MNFRRVIPEDKSAEVAHVLNGALPPGARAIVILIAADGATELLRKNITQAESREAFRQLTTQRPGHTVKGPRPQ